MNPDEKSEEFVRGIQHGARRKCMDSGQDKSWEGVVPEVKALKICWEPPHGMLKLG